MPASSTILPETEKAFIEAERLTETPPADRYCDLVLTGGVASGVVYPWAIIELARQYHFRSIGGTSVGAVAAALTAASEYGRRKNSPYPFEVLRRVPEELARNDEHGETKMLRLFQPNKSGKRLFSIFVYSLRVSSANRAELESQSLKNQLKLLVARIRNRKSTPTNTAQPSQGRSKDESDPLNAESLGSATGFMKIALFAASHFLRDTVIRTLKNRWVQSAFLVDLIALAVSYINISPWWWLANGFAWFATFAFAVVVCVMFVRSFGAVLLDDIRDGFVANAYGACSGLSQKVNSEGKKEQGFTEWMHEGIQRSAGFGVNDRPLTFLDLWYVSLPTGQSASLQTPDPERILAPAERSIDLQIFVSNLTLGVPLKFPLVDPSIRLFYDPEEWRKFFPESVVNFLANVSSSYRPATASDPLVACFERDSNGNPISDDSAKRLLELPISRLPIVVAARLSMSFPILFSAIPVYAIDFEEKRYLRVLRKCILSDGGICSNFPIHLFDSPIPAWPTFGLYLDRSIAAYADTSVRLPSVHTDGRSPIWNRFMPEIERSMAQSSRLDSWVALRSLGGLLLGVVSTAKDWGDRVNLLMPQTRNRVVRLALKSGEGQLNIAMSRETILQMAYKYGTKGGKLLVENFTPKDEKATKAWKEHLYIRTNILVNSLRSFVDGTVSSALNQSHSVPIRELSKEWVTADPDGRILAINPLIQGPLLPGVQLNVPDPSGVGLTKNQRSQLLAAVEAIEGLEKALSSGTESLPYLPDPKPTLRVRSDAS
jgi:predicted acylesterase/phospholipase RssA